LTNKLSISPELVAGHTKETRWRPEFNIDLDVKKIDPVPMPERPDKSIEFQELISVSQLFTVAKQRSIAYETKTKVSNGPPDPPADKYKALSRSFMEKVCSSSKWSRR